MAVSDDKNDLKPRGARRMSGGENDMFGRALRELALRFDAEQDRWFLWSPVALGAGVGAYFSISSEPDWWMAILPILVSAVMVWKWGANRAQGFALLLAVLIASFGFAVAKLRTEIVAAPKLGSRLGPVSVEGQVVALRPRPSGRVSALIDVVRIGSLEPEATPARVRLTMAPRIAPDKTGDLIKVLSILRPPPRPVAPGAYDFSRRAWFERVGANGFTLRPPELLAEPPEVASSWTRVAMIWISAVRQAAAARIANVVEGQGGPVAVALLTGLRGRIPQDDIDVIRDAGLAHLLAISGLHMALMSGAAFWAVRFVIAAFPWLAVRVVSKKWAALAGLVTGLMYFFLAGGSVATERAFIMVAIALVAVMVDRPAISLRNMALAALIILLIKPESMLEAGFHMSFAAVTALAAFYEGTAAWLQRSDIAEHHSERKTIGPIVFKILGGVVLTTIVASLATAPFAAAHFNRIAVYGLAANSVAVPLVGFVVMPLGLIALVLMPFGLDAPALALMGAGTGYLVEISRTVAAWPGATAMVASPAGAALPVLAAGGLWLSLWRGSWRFWGIAPIAIAIGMFSITQSPDILISEDGKRIAVRSTHGQLTLSPGRGARYATGQWLRRDGDDRTAKEAVGDSTLAPGLVCDPRGCIAHLASGRNLSYIRHPSGIVEDCQTADIVVSAIPLRGRCKGPKAVIDRFDLYRDGAHAIYLTTAGPVVRSVSMAVGHRPWARYYRKARQ